MHNASFSIHRAVLIVAGALVSALVATTAVADQIDVSLNVFYQNPSDVNSGGTWEVVAKSDRSGIAGLELLLSNINTPVTNVAPRGFVNGSDPAGFGILGFGPNPLYTIIGIGQALIPPSLLGPTEEQAAFYGVGTLTNGAPNYPGKPAGTNSLGPAFTTLTNVQEVPWATGDVFQDPDWNTAVRMVSGTFAPGVTPGFFDSATAASSGNLFTSVGDSRNPGGLQTVDLNTIVRTNFTTAVLPGDFSGNGAVENADLTLLLDNWGAPVPPVPTGWDGDQPTPAAVDNDELTRLLDNWGASGQDAGLSTTAVPEPDGVAMLALACLPVLASRPGRPPAKRAGATKNQRGIAR